MTKIEISDLNLVFKFYDGEKIPDYFKYDIEDQELVDFYNEDAASVAIPISPTCIIKSLLFMYLSFLGRFIPVSKLFSMIIGLNNFPGFDIF